MDFKYLLRPFERNLSKHLFVCYEQELLLLLFKFQAFVRWYHRNGNDQSKALKTIIEAIETNIQELGNQLRDCLES